MIRAISCAAIIVLVAICSRESVAETTESHLTTEPTMVNHTNATAVYPNLEMFTNAELIMDDLPEDIVGLWANFQDVILIITSIAVRDIDVRGLRTILTAIIAMATVFSRGEINIGDVARTAFYYLGIIQGIFFVRLMYRMIVIIRILEEEWRNHH